MRHIQTSPLPAQDRRRETASNSDGQKDLRWRLLDLVRRCRTALNLRDRDVAILRGLLTLLPEGATQRTVFASNRVLIERCDGVEERTLRRRIAHLEACGLVARRQSPNGKRYQIRDGSAAVLTYGIDLAPLFTMEGDLLALKGSIEHNTQQTKALRAMIRDWLYHHAEPGCALHEEARLALRRKLDCADLRQLYQELCGPAPQPETAAVKEEMSASDSQTVRHIQRSNTDDLDSETCAEPCATGRASPPVAAKDRDITVAECFELATSAKSLAPSQPRNWPEVIALAGLLAPSIGIGSRVLGEARCKLGPLGTALAVLGLLESFDRIRSPEAYLSALTKKAAGLDMVRMFRSLVSPQSARA